MRRTLTALACSVALAAAAAGCGETDQERAREVVQDYADARNAGDFEAVCELLSQTFVTQLETADCPGFIAEQTAGADGDEDLEVVDVRVRDGVATAELDVTTGSSQDPIRIGLRLREEDGEWRITGLQ